MMTQIVTGFLGSFVFAIFFNMKGRQVICAGFGGGVTWILYLILTRYIEGLFLPTLLASIFVGIYAELMAKINRSPATGYLTIGAIILIPGGRLYYTMLGLVTKNDQMFLENGQMALLIALAISLGFVLFAITMKYINFIKNKRII